MDIASVIFWAVLVLLMIYIVSIYNHLVRIKHNVSKAWSNIDVLLKQIGFGHCTYLRVDLRAS